jgi:hypothetical protein
MKEDVNGSKTYKARYVAKGFSQVKGIDYQETFAPTVNHTTLRTFMQIAAQHDLILHQMDVKTAYLNVPIDCEIFVEQPQGFEIPSKSDRRLVCKLHKSLHGLKQAGRNWNGMLHGCLIENSFEQSEVDHCLYIKHVQAGMIGILIWVDDLIIGASNHKLLSDVKEMLKRKFRMKDLGKLAYFLGIDFEQGGGVVKMNQKRYLLERFDMTNCKPRATPSEQKLEGNCEDEVDSKRYREIVGLIFAGQSPNYPSICPSHSKSTG